MIHLYDISGRVLSKVTKNDDEIYQLTNIFIKGT